MPALSVRWGDAVVGALTADRHGAMRFAYDAGWLADPAAPALSCSLPKRPEPFRPRECRPFFEGLLPEGAQRDAVAAACGISPANEFALLERLGGDVAGALTLRPADEEFRSADAVQPAKGVPPTNALDDRELADILASLGARPLLAGTRGLRLSLAGAQSKLPVVLVGGRVALPAPGQPTTHILKPPIARFPATTENEAFAMRLAARLGADTAPVEPYAVADGHCLLVTRYDRRREEDGTVRRLHQEDFCQALGVLWRDSRRESPTGPDESRRRPEPPGRGLLRQPGGSDAAPAQASRLVAPPGRGEQLLLRRLLRPRAAQDVQQAVVALVAVVLEHRLVVAPR